MAHKCACLVCKLIVQNDSMLMCKAHWFELTPSERSNVYASLNRFGPGTEHIRNILPILEAQAKRLKK